MNEFSGYDRSGFVSSLRKEQEIIKTKFPEVATAAESVLLIESRNGSRHFSRGSGCAISIDGEERILTCLHVVKDHKEAFIRLSDAGVGINMRLNHIAVFPELDIALLPMPEEFEGFLDPILFAQTVDGIAESFLVGYPKIDWLLTGYQDKYGPTVHPSSIEIVKEGKLIVNAGSSLGDPHGISGGALLSPDGKLMGIPYKKLNNGFLAVVSIDTIRNTTGLEFK